MIKNELHPDIFTIDNLFSIKECDLYVKQYQEKNLKKLK
jgi:hypothetical protein